MHLFICYIFLAIVFIIGLPAHAVDPPTFAKTSGSFVAPQTVYLTAPAGTIYYTTDSSIPTVASTQYLGPFTVSSSEQINAVAYSGGVYSSVSTIYLDVDRSLAPILQSSLILRLRSDLGIEKDIGTSAAVIKWCDLSGIGNNAFSNQGSRPFFQRGSIDNLPAVDFNGTSEYLTLPPGFSNFSNGVTMFMVVKPTALTGNARLIDFGNGASGNNILFQIANSGSYGEFWTYNGISGTSVQSSAALTQSQWQLIEAVQSSTTGIFYLNGTPGTTNSSMSILPLITRTSNFIGRASSGSNYYSGSIAEILLYSAALSDTQRTAIETYLMQKYQLPPVSTAAPIISVPSGTLAGPTQVVISSQSGTATYITTDGSTPTNTSQVYCGHPIIINYSQTLKAISIKNGVSSSVTTATYTLDSNQWPAPNPGDMSAPNINLQLPVQTQ